MADWHDFFKRAYEQAGSTDGGEFAQWMAGYKQTFERTVDNVVEDGVDRLEAVLWVLDMSEKMGGPMRLLAHWAEELWPELLDDEEDGE
jgi:hypothetical protein